MIYLVSVEYSLTCGYGLSSNVLLVSPLLYTHTAASIYRGCSPYTDYRLFFYDISAQILYGIYTTILCATSYLLFVPYNPLFRLHTFRLEYPLVYPEKVFCGITFCLHPHSGWIFVSLSAFAQLGHKKSAGIAACALFYVWDVDIIP